jgi:serine protease AprX
MAITGVTKMRRTSAAGSRARAALRVSLVFAVLFGGGVIGISGRAPAHRARLSADLLLHESRHSPAPARVIVHGSKAELARLAARHHVAVLRWLDGAAVVQADSAQLSALAGDPAVDHLSGDLPVAATMSVSNSSMAADQARAGSSGLLGLGSIPPVTGQGIVVAVVDSGIASHVELAKKVVASVSFVTGDPSTDDAYGHGTHVAGIIAGSASPAAAVTSLYNGGIAPGAQLVNVRVLGATGAGYTSDVIAGIDWVIANRNRYGIRIINLSLGHPVVEPAETDPLCEAVARAVSAGLTVVASAGNAGRDGAGHRVLGGITSPGNSPLAITVGALNTWGTIQRGDDTVATYSSRGPTKFDLAVKPDLAAPGTSIVSLEADGSYLSRTYPFLHRAGGGNNSYMQLSGTSMAAPMISGAAALLLDGVPTLTTAQLKLALQSGSTYLPEGGLMGAGAGSANVWVARKITANGLSALTNTLLDGIASPSGASFWDAGTLSSRLYDGVGVRLLSLLDLSQVWSNTSLLHYGDLNLVGLLNPLRSVAPNPLIWGEVSRWTTSDAIIWGTQIYDPEGEAIIWGTSADDDAIIWGTGTLTAPEPR